MPRQLLIVVLQYTVMVCSVDNCVHSTFARICTSIFSISEMTSHMQESREQYNAMIYSCHVPTCQASLNSHSVTPYGVLEHTNLFNEIIYTQDPSNKQHASTCPDLDHVVCSGKHKGV